MPVSSDLTLIQLFEVLSDTAQLSFLRRCLPNQAYKRQQTSRSCRRHPDRMRIFTTKNICDSTAAQSRSTRRSRAASAGLVTNRPSEWSDQNGPSLTTWLRLPSDFRSPCRYRTFGNCGRSIKRDKPRQSLVASHAQRIELTAEVAEHDCPVAGHSGLGLPLFTSLPD